MAIVTSVAVVFTTSVRGRTGGVLPSVVGTLGIVGCTRVTLRSIVLLAPVRTVSVSVVSGI